MIQNEEILALIDEFEPYIVSCRRTIHGLAELSGQEFQTKAFILEQVRSLGLPYEEVPTTGLIVQLETGRPGKTLALRADIDALPVAESPTNLKGERACVSGTGKTCHACGHDGHTSMLLGAMQVLTRLKDRLSGTVLFCFEEGEETNCGIEAMMEALEKYPVDQCWGIHLYAGLEEGKVSVDAGARMAGCIWTNVTFKGKGGHGSRPDMAANPLFAAAAFLMNLETAMAQQITAGQTVTQGITTCHCGQASNVIAETCELGGSMRFFSQEEGAKAQEIFTRVAQATAPIYGCTVELGGQPRVPALINDAESAAVAQRALEGIFPAGTLAHCEPWFASETFAHFAIRYPSVFALVGIQNKAEGYGAPHHNEKFDFNEKVLRTGATATVRYTVEWLARD